MMGYTEVSITECRAFLVRGTFSEGRSQVIAVGNHAAKDRETARFIAEQQFLWSGHRQGELTDIAVYHDTANNRVTLGLDRPVIEYVRGWGRWYDAFQKSAGPVVAKKTRVFSNP